MGAIVVARQLTKAYQVPVSDEDRYHTLRSDFALALSKGRRARRTRTLLAVNQVSFEVGKGEAVGLIGPNGAGKSTLMKLLARVTVPTSGTAEVRGKVGALLEVGTGFHPELTGRENVFLSGAFLGMSKRDTAARFDEIVAFSELAGFIDLPVKRYSSGMYARLGFAVAAHLRPALLIVDEALSVGDLSYQAKCLARMQQLSNEGTSVLFVSHNLLAVADFCTRTMLLVAGTVRFDGRSSEAISEYRKSLRAEPDPSQPTADTLSLTVNGTSAGIATIGSGQPVRVVVEVGVPSSGAGAKAFLNLVIESSDGRLAMHLRSDFSDHPLQLRAGRNAFVVSIDELPLAPGDYWLWARLVSIDGSEPLIWDSGRTLLEIPGDRVSDALMQPVHRFETATVAEVAPATRRGR